MIYDLIIAIKQTDDDKYLIECDEECLVFDTRDKLRQYIVSKLSSIFDEEGD